MTNYQIDYQIHGHFDPHRRVEVEATREEIARFVEEGYLVWERLFNE